MCVCAHASHDFHDRAKGPLGTNKPGACYGSGLTGVGGPSGHAVGKDDGGLMEAAEWGEWDGLGLSVLGDVREHSPW